MRINLTLDDKDEWMTLYKESDSTIFVASEEPPPIGSLVRIDLIVGSGGPKIIFRGNVIARRLQGERNLPKGCSVALGRDEREKINYLNVYVRGGYVNLRKARRIPVRLKVTYGDLEGPVNTFTRDINDEGVFIITRDPLPEGFELSLLIEIPGRSDPVPLSGIVVHTVVVEDEDIPGMGVRFSLNDSEAADFTELLNSLEASFLKGRLADEYLA